MVAQKRKAVAKGAGNLFAEVAAKAEIEKDMEADEDDVETSAEEEEEKVNEKELAKQREQEINETRKKELKAMYVDELKELASKKGIQVSKRDEIIEAILKRDAKERQATRDQEARVRSVVVEKKEGLEGLTYSELRARCDAAGIAGKLPKDACVEQLLKAWLEANGVNNTLARMDRDKRKGELDDMEKQKLRKLCEKAGVDPFVKEIMVERIVKREIAAGRFARPVLPKDELDASSEGASNPKIGKEDVVQALLASEASRKKEKELRQQEMDRMASKMKDLNSLSVQDIKKKLAKKGLEAEGKKEELVATLLKISLQEEAEAARKAKMLALSLPDLKTLIESQGLQASGKKEQMVEAFFAHEAKLRKELEAFEAKCSTVEAKKREALEEKSGGELKQLCVDKELKLGVTKEERVERLLEAAKQDGEFDEGVAVMASEARKGELLACDTPSLLKLCEQIGADPLVKEIMVERLLSHEKGDAGDDDDEDSPVRKKARK